MRVHAFVVIYKILSSSAAIKKLKNNVVATRCFKFLKRVHIRAEKEVHFIIGFESRSDFAIAL
jgi:hypothetical protein